jgi:hypothetical protein
MCGQQKVGSMLLPSSICSHGAWSVGRKRCFDDTCYWQW